MKKQICLMIECENNKYIFTNKKNISYISEFANNFKLKLHYAKTNTQNIVGMEKVAKLFCDQTYVSPSDFVIVQKNIGSNTDNRLAITTKAKQIRQKIIKILLKHKIVTFKQIIKKFETENISVSALSNHFTHVRHELIAKGVKIVKVKNGIYEVFSKTKKPAS